MNFEDSFQFVMKWEGGDAITDDPDDPGGVTKYGISQRSFPMLDIKELSEQHAQNIYRHEYWLKSKANKLPEALRLAHFDASVNMGVKAANKLLQKALKVDSDGIVGVKTLRAANDKGADVLSDLLAYRALFYIGLVKRKPAMSKFMFGWLRRISDIGIQTGL